MTTNRPNERDAIAEAKRTGLVVTKDRHGTLADGRDTMMFNVGRATLHRCRDDGRACWHGFLDGQSIGGYGYRAEAIMLAIRAQRPEVAS